MLFVFLIINVFQLNSHNVESFYSRKLYPLVSHLASPIGRVSWSVGDVFYMVIVGVLLVQLGVFIFSILNKERRRTLPLHFWSLCNGMLLILILFKVSWGINYYRVPLRDYLALNAHSATRDELLQTTQDFIITTNELRRKLIGAEINRKAIREEVVDFVKEDTLLNGYLHKDNGLNIKAPISSSIVNYFLVSGYFNPFSLEAQVNQNTPWMSFPFTAVHELGHKMGIGFEDECNFLAFYLLKDHDNISFKYSAYYSAVRYLLLSVSQVAPQEYANLYQSLSSLVKIDMQEERSFWLKQQTLYGELTSDVYQNYLILNNQPEGLIRYNLFVELLLAFNALG